MLTVGLKLEMVHAETRRERMGARRTWLEVGVVGSTLRLVLGKPKEWIVSGACGGATRGPFGWVIWAICGSMNCGFQDPGTRPRSEAISPWNQEVRGFQTLRKPNPSKSFTFTVANVVTPWERMVSAVRTS